ncbi:MAG TPA: SpaA isopeptide-forming pilin-related protein, partial [Patescibacteria group bacterium]|nr:SpaA isopeptide-forming pilin-related protein [Patescibacteria group bacterium]
YTLTSETDLTSTPLPSGELTGETTYYWRVAYTNAFGNRSAYSACTSFTTLRTMPTFSGSIEDQSMNEDTPVINAFDLDDYFFDTEGETLSFSAAVDDSAHVTVTIEENNTVSFDSSEHWFGNTTLTFIACDTDNECISSNEITLTVHSVNDSPTAPTSGFSPANDATTSSLQPTISWDAATDVEDTADQLFYELRISTSASPATNAKQTLITEVNEINTQLTDALEDLTTYYYVVRTIDSEEATSNWSSIQSFSTNEGRTPNITLTKSMENLNTNFALSATGKAISQVTGWRPNSIQLSATATLGVSVATLVSSFIGLLLLLKNVDSRKILAVIMRHPAVAFATIVDRRSNGTYAQSYSAFCHSVVPLARAFQVSGIATVLFFAFNIAVLAHSQTTESTIAPGDTVRFTVTYQNSGDGSATNAVFSDLLPSDITLNQDSIQIDGTDNTTILSADTSSFTIALNTISPSTSGSVSYEGTLNNPVSTTPLIAPSASLSANELTGNTIAYSNSITAQVASSTTTITVTNADGEVLPNVAIELYFESISNTTKVYTENTNNNGRVSIAGLRAGNYYVTAEAGDTYTAVEPQRISVSYNQTTAVYIVLSSSNSNTNTNTNTNSNINANENTNINTNHNTNTVVPTETPNLHNTNTAENDNENDNINKKPPKNNENSHSTNTPIIVPLDLPVTSEQRAFLEQLPPLTEKIIELTKEEEQLFQETVKKSIREFAEKITVKIGGEEAQTMREEEMVYFRRPQSCSARTWFAELIGKEEPVTNDQLIFDGDIALPELLQKKFAESDVPIRLRIVIFSDPLVQIAKINEGGEWHMEFSIEALGGDQHIALAEVSANGVSSGMVEITKFAVDQKPCASWTPWIIVFNLILFSGIGLLLYIRYRKKRKKFPPTIPPPPQEPHLTDKK